MNKDNLINQINKYLKNRIKRNRLLALLGLLSILTIVAVYTTLMQPAVSMEKSNPIIEAKVSEAGFGETIPVRISARGDKENNETVFMLSFEGINAGLSSDYLFKDGFCIIKDLDGELFALHQSDDRTRSDYWFSLDDKETRKFDLNLVSYHSLEDAPEYKITLTEEILVDIPYSEVKAAEEEKEEETLAEDQDMVDSQIGDPEADLAIDQSLDEPALEEKLLSQDSYEQITVKEVREEDDPNPPPSYLGNLGDRVPLSIYSASGVDLAQAQKTVTSIKTSDKEGLDLVWMDPGLFSEPNREITALLYEDSDLKELVKDEVEITITGAISEDILAVAYPKDDIRINNQRPILAYDIHLIDKNTRKYVTASNKKLLNVTIDLNKELRGSYTMYYIAESGEAQALDTTVIDKQISFKTDHFSTYALIEDIEENIKDPLDKDSQLEANNKKEPAKEKDGNLEEEATNSVLMQFTGEIPDNSELVATPLENLTVNGLTPIAAYQIRLIDKATGYDLELDPDTDIELTIDTGQKLRDNHIMYYVPDQGQAQALETRVSDTEVSFTSSLLSSTFALLEESFIGVPAITQAGLETPGDVILSLAPGVFKFDGSSIDKYEVKVSGPAPGYKKVEDAYGYLAYFDSSKQKWIKVEDSEFEKEKARDIEFEFEEEDLTLNRLLDIPYCYFITAAKIEDDDGGESQGNLDPPGRSQVFYLADLFKEGFRDWALDYYPDAHNKGNPIKNIAELSSAYNIYTSYSLDVGLSPDKDSYQAGETVKLDFIVKSLSDLRKNTVLYLDLRDSLGDFIASSGSLILTSEDAQIIASDEHLIAIKITERIKKEAIITFNYSYKLASNSIIGNHQIKAIAQIGSQYGAGQTNYDVNKPGLQIVSIAGGDGSYYPGDQLTYSLEIKNFGSSASSLLEIAAEIDGESYYDKKAINREIPPGQTISVEVAFISTGLSGGDKDLKFKIKDSNNLVTSMSKTLRMIETSVILTPEISLAGTGTIAKLTSSIFPRGKYSQVWQYRDGTGDWLTLNEKAPGEEITKIFYPLTPDQLADLRALEDSGVRQYRLVLTSATNRMLYSQPASFANIEDLITMAKIEADLDIDLTLATLSTYYYDEVRKDPKVPFYDAASFTKLLLEAYGDNKDLSALKQVYYQYIYDIMDPNLIAGYRAGPAGDSQAYPYNIYPVESDHADRNYQWYKDAGGSNSSPFHNKVASKINPLNAILEDGVLMEGSSFRNLEKTAKADLEGDKNRNRNYTVDIKATAEGCQARPTVIVFQVQSSWQMFNLGHANGINGKKSPANVNITDMASLYDIKHAMIDFAKWIKENGDGSVVFAVTDVEHAGTFSAIQDPYLTNDMDSLITALQGWDIFGNCEHIHYKNDALINAINKINETTLGDWVDANGNKVLQDAQKVAVIIGGTTENDAGTNGYGAVFPKVAAIDKYYTIETVSGTLQGGRPRLSWLDTPANITTVRDTGGVQYKNVTSREALVETFKEILNKSKKPTTLVEESIIKDTIQAEFNYRPGSMKLVCVTNGLETTTSIADNDPNLTFNTDDDGNQVISYKFGPVAYGESIHLRFGLEAKEDYIGSNNVLTNVGVPNLTYKTDLGAYVKQEFESTPKVNVPIRFPISDGLEAQIRLGTTIGLAKDERLKAKDIVAGIENYILGIEYYDPEAQDYKTKYSQINGEVKYQWELLAEDGHIPIYTYDASTGCITNARGDPPDYNQIFTPEMIGKYPFRLKVSFTPQEAEVDSGVAVGPLSKEGNISLKVEALESVTLPSTGGMGSRCLSLFGILLTLGSVILLLLQKTGVFERGSDGTNR